jgi:ATP-dependent Clp protease adaptor protein ClpS
VEFTVVAPDATRGTMTASPTPAPTADPVIDPALDEAVTGDLPWQAVVWNDPVNLMSYVTYVLQKLFGYPEPKATALMLDVHHKGKAAVSSGDREKIEGDVAKLHAAGLWATMQRV